MHFLTLYFLVAFLIPIAFFSPDDSIIAHVMVLVLNTFVMGVLAVLFLYGHRLGDLAVPDQEQQDR